MCDKVKLASNMQAANKAAANKQTADNKTKITVVTIEFTWYLRELLT